MFHEAEKKERITVMHSSHQASDISNLPIDKHDSIMCHLLEFDVCFSTNINLVLEPVSKCVSYYFFFKLLKDKVFSNLVHDNLHSVPFLFLIGIKSKKISTFFVGLALNNKFHQYPKQ